MDSKKKSSSAGSIGFLGLLSLVFIALKLTGAISWSWWWVLSPLWIPTAVTLLIFIVLAIGVVSVAIEKARKIPVTKGRNLEKLAKINGLQRGYMESDARLRKRITEAIKPKDRRSNK